MLRDEKPIQRLSGLLRLAAEKLASLHGPIWSSFDSGPEIAEFVSQCRLAIESGSLAEPQKTRLWQIFAPTGYWDDIMDDQELANAIFSLLNFLYGADVTGGGQIA